MLVVLAVVVGLRGAQASITAAEDPGSNLESEQLFNNLLEINVVNRLFHIFVS